MFWKCINQEYILQREIPEKQHTPKYETAGKTFFGSWKAGQFVLFLIYSFIKTQSKIKTSLNKLFLD